MAGAWTLFAAIRYFWSSRRGRNAASSALSVLQMALGTAILIVVTGVMNGFQTGFISSILEIGSYHVRIDLPLERLEAARDTLEADKRVRSVTRFADVQALAQGRGASARAVNVRLLDDDALGRDQGLAEALGFQPGEIPLLGPGEIVLGRELGNWLGLREGAEVELTSIGLDPELGLIPERFRFRLRASFSSAGKWYEYDQGWALASFESGAGMLAGQAAASLGIKLADRSADAAFIESLKGRQVFEGAEIVSWREANRAFFGALRMEKTVLMLVIGLVFLIIAANIFHSMQRSVRERREALGVLRAIGSSPAEIIRIFVIEGAMIGLAGALAGLVLGLALTYNINAVFAALERGVNAFLGLSLALAGRGAARDFAIFSPRYFYIDQVPAAVFFSEALTAFIASLGSALAASVLAARPLSKLNPQEIIRNE